MRDLDGKVAVVTGAASGIGLALAERFASAGMKVVLADVESGALEGAIQEMRRREFDVLGVLCDVTRADSVEELAERALERYGKVHVLCNNAGVAAPGTVGGGMPIWEFTLKDWQWIVGVNFWGVVHGVRTFLPIMLRQEEEGHVVNTASLAGLIAGSGIYGVTKHAVVALSESVHSQLRQQQAKVGISVLCPGFVSTRLHEAGRNRPLELSNDAVPVAGESQAQQMLRDRVLGGKPTAEIAEAVLQAIGDGRFYILTHPEFDAAIRARMETILDRRGPAPRPPA